MSEKTKSDRKFIGKVLSIVDSKLNDSEFEQFIILIQRAAEPPTCGACKHFLTVRNDNGEVIHTQCNTVSYGSCGSSIYPPINFGCNKHSDYEEKK